MFKSEEFDTVVNPRIDKTYREIHEMEFQKASKNYQNLAKKEGSPITHRQEETYTSLKNAAEAWTGGPQGPFKQGNIYVQPNAVAPLVPRPRRYLGIRCGEPTPQVDVAENYLHSFVLAHSSQFKFTDKWLIVGFHPEVVDSLGIHPDVWCDTVACTRLQPYITSDYVRKCTFEDLTDVTTAYDVVLVNNATGKLSPEQVRYLIMVSRGSFTTFETADMRGKPGYGPFAMRITDNTPDMIEVLYTNKETVRFNKSRMEGMITMPILKTPNAMVSIRRNQSHVCSNMALTVYESFVTLPLPVEMNKQYNRTEWALVMANEISIKRNYAVFGDTFVQRETTQVFKIVDVPDLMELGQTNLSIETRKKLYLDVTEYDDFQAYLAGKNSKDHIAAVSAYIASHFKSSSKSDQLCLLMHAIILMSSATDKDITEAAEAVKEPEELKTVELSFLIQNPWYVDYHSYMVDDDLALGLILTWISQIWAPFSLVLICWSIKNNHFKQLGYELATVGLAMVSILTIFISVIPLVYALACLVFNPSPTSYRLSISSWAKSAPNPYSWIRNDMTEQLIKETNKANEKSLEGYLENHGYDPEYDQETREAGEALLVEIGQRLDVVNKATSFTPSESSEFKMLHKYGTRGHEREDPGVADTQRRERDVQGLLNALTDMMTKKQNPEDVGHLYEML